MLRKQVQNGLRAMNTKHTKYLDDAVRSSFADSLNLDAALQRRHPTDHRWDYLLGHAPSRSAIGLEPHSAKQDEVSTVIAKRCAALRHLRGHMRPGARVAAWLWVASGKVYFADTGKERRRLDQNGVTFVGTKVLEKHLQALRQGGR